MASTHRASEPEPLFPFEFIRQPAEVREPTMAANLVTPKSSSKEADEPDGHCTSPSSRRADRHTKRRRNLTSAAAAIPAEGDRYVSLAGAGAIFGVSPETLRRRISDGSLPANKGGYNLIRVLLSNVARLFPPIPAVDPEDYERW